MSFLRMFPKRRLKSNPPSVEDIPPENYANFHVISGDDPNSETIKHETVPSYRSGHRIFTTHDFLFCIGGYDAPNGNGLIHKEIWRMNLLTKQWIRMEFENPQDFPETLASFAICQTGPLSNKVILYGGTSIPFGLTSGSTPYLLTMLPDGKVKCEKIDAPRGPRGVYGHAMVRSPDPNDCKYYVVGGTTGHSFYLDIHCLSLNSNGSQLEWKWEDTAEWNGTGDQNEPQGLYRLECIIDDKKMLIFGGGTPDYVQGFDKMYCYDFEQNRFGIVHTKGDPNGEDATYPAPRRCHSVVQYGRKVILAGGCGIDGLNQSGDRSNQIYGDVWIFDLDSYGWTKHHSDLSIAVFFHAAAITLDGCLFIHGGVCSETSKHRTNTLQALWISPPNLLHWASQFVYKEFRKHSLDKKRSKKPREDEVEETVSELIVSRSYKLYNLVLSLVVEENRKKGPTPAVEDSRVTVAPNMPLSCFQRVFPTPYRPIPVNYQPVKVSFNHYRRRPPPPPINIVPQQTSLTSFVLTSKRDENHGMTPEDSEECAPGDPEMRWRCNWLDCPKRFKNGPALRMHMRTAHHAAQIARTPVEEQPLAHQHSASIAAALESSSVASPTKYAQSRPHKCDQCSKRYKTVQGLQNHVSQAHQKLNGSRTPDTNSQSPAALAQLIIKKTQEHQNVSERQNYPQQSGRPLPVSLASQNSSHQGHLPVRSFQVQSGRMQSQQMQTTGQMLKQQMQQQLMQQPNQQQQPQHVQQQSVYSHSQPQQYGMEQAHNSGSAHPSAFGTENRSRMVNQSQEQAGEIKPFV